MKELPKAPKISIVVPIFNQEKYITLCLESILKQSFKDFELILVNDGSTDNSLSICKQYALKDQRIIIIDKKNEGVTKARKDGFLKARGKYTSYIDSDDYLADNALETLYTIAEDNDADLVIGNFDRVFDSKGFLKQRARGFSIETERLLGNNEEKNKQSFLPSLLSIRDGRIENKWAFYMWGRIYRTEAIIEAYKKNGEVLFPAYTKSALIEDQAFNLAVSPFLNRVWLTNKVVLHYRYGGATSRDFPIIRLGGKFFDSKFDSCIKYNHIDLLDDVFVYYCNRLALDVIFQFHFHVNSKNKIIEFVRNEFEKRSVVLWMREHPLKEEKTELQNAVIMNDPTLFVELCSKKERHMWLHFQLKKIILLYQTIIDKII